MTEKLDWDVPIVYMGSVTCALLLRMACSVMAEGVEAE